MGHEWEIKKFTNIVIWKYRIKISKENQEAGCKNLNMTERTYGMLFTSRFDRLSQLSQKLPEPKRSAQC